MATATSRNNRIEVEGSVPETIIKTSNQRCTVEGFYKCVQNPSKIVKMVKNQAFPSVDKNKVSWALMTTKASLAPEV